MYGVQTVIAVDSQKVKDVLVQSKHCDLCKVWRNKRDTGKITQAEFDTWRTSHAQSCQINTTVSSPAMETEAVKQLWARSEEVNELKYTTYVGDGDCKGHSAVVEMKPYGDIGVQKEECVGHVRKRLGKNLRDLRQRLGKQKLTDGKPIGGKGRLTDKRIDSLQHYYGDAIKQHPNDVPEMYKAIWASFCHSGSTAEAPHHQFCPVGPDSWCGYQKEKAGGPKYTLRGPLPKAVFDEVKPIYVRLTDRDLLNRCSRSATQNANESLNGLIWTMCPKETFCSRQVVETALNLAVVLVNDGYEKVSDVLALADCAPTPSTLAFLSRFDQDKAYHKRKKSSEEEESARKKETRSEEGIC